MAKSSMGGSVMSWAISLRMHGGVYSILQVQLGEMAVVGSEHFYS